MTQSPRKELTNFEGLLPCPFCGITPKKISE
jgi:hypothetical protein